MQPSLLFSISLLFLLVRVAFKLRSLRFHSPRLCRITVFLIQNNVSLSAGELRRHEARAEAGGVWGVRKFDVGDDRVWI